MKKTTKLISSQLATCDLRLVPCDLRLATCILYLATCIFLLSSCSHVKQSPPNIIFIMADDLGYNELGCYGQDIIRTPNIDKLAKEGMMFTNFYSGSPVCAPSRCVLMTGMHTGHALSGIMVRLNPKDKCQSPIVF